MKKRLQEEMEKTERADSEGFADLGSMRREVHEQIGLGLLNHIRN